MAARKAHKKSRTGCIQCKQRRVKCDERGPPCVNCTIREIECTYTNPGQRLPSLAKPGTPVPAVSAQQTQQSASTPNSQQSATLLASPVASEGYANLAHIAPESAYQNHRLLELELFNHYSTTCYKSCFSQGFEGFSQTDIWQTFIPRQALRHEFLMHGIFALSALHLSTVASATDRLGPLSLHHNPTYYVQRALEYQNLALVAFRRALENVTQDNCNAIFAFSIITMLLSIAFPDSELREAATPEARTPTQTIMGLIDLLHGVASVVSICRHWLNQGPFEPILSMYRHRNLGIGKLSPEADEALLQLNKTAQSMVEQVGEVQVNIYQEAIKQLRFCFDCIACRLPSKNPDRGMVVGWLVMAGKEFTNLLKQGDEMALLILLHWGVLLDHLANFWWSENSGRALVEDIIRQLNARNGQWQEATKWARMEVGLLTSKEDDRRDTEIER